MDVLPLVSVIIPVYNVKPYLGECIESVINQTYNNLEIIIIDDGSTDASALMCDDYKGKDTRIQVIHQSNKGLSGARNTGLEQSHGDIIAFLDSDDDYLPNMIETMVQIMLESNADIVVCGYYVCRTENRMNQFENERCFLIPDGIKSNGSALRLLFDGTIDVTTWNKVFSRHLFDNIRFPDGYVYEDQIIMPYLFESAMKIALLKQALVLHRIRSASITNTTSEKNIHDMMYARVQMDIFVEAHTPYVFNTNYQKYYQEKTFRCIIGYYLTLLSTNKMIERCIVDDFENEIDKRANNIHLFSYKTRLYFQFFKMNPSLCSAVKRLLYAPVKKRVQSLGTTISKHKKS